MVAQISVQFSGMKHVSYHSLHSFSHISSWDIYVRYGRLQIFCICQILDKKWKYNGTIHYLQIFRRPM